MSGERRCGRRRRSPSCCACTRWAGAPNGSPPSWGAGNTVRRYLRRGGRASPRAPERRGALDGLGAWPGERLRRHRGNADVVRQELLAEHGLAVSLRTVERAVRPWRRELVAQACTKVRLETPPRHPLRIHFRTAALDGSREAER